MDSYWPPGFTEPRSAARSTPSRCWPSRGCGRDISPDRGPWCRPRKLCRSFSEFLSQVCKNYESQFPKKRSLNFPYLFENPYDTLRRNHQLASLFEKRKLLSIFLSVFLICIFKKSRNKYLKRKLYILLYYFLYIRFFHLSDDEY